MADPRGKALVSPLFARVETAARKMFGGDNERYGTEGAIGMDIMTMFSDMPLVSVLMFLRDALEKHPEDLVDELLEQAHNAD